MTVIDSDLLNKYVQELSSLTCKKTAGLIAPHKAVLLVAIIDCTKHKLVSNGLIPINDTLRGAFEHIWGKYIKKDSPFKPAFSTPFFHMQKEHFWKLMKTEDYVERQEYSIGQLKTSFFGAKIDDELWDFFENEETRNILRDVLVKKYLRIYSY
ncbi:MAG: hypothetical protein MJZ32_07090 [Bacteroidaceae bacterium]|nr:hypothetical protein [Bacteroidaceae bacterium]